MSGLSVSSFTSAIFISGWTRIELLSAAVSSASSQTNAATLNLLPKLIYALCSIVTKFITFSLKNHPHHLYFRWRNLITGWSISKISTSFYHSLIALGIRRNAMENSDGQLRYSRTTRGTVSAPSAVQGLTITREIAHLSIILCVNMGLL